MLDVSAGAFREMTFCHPSSMELNGSQYLIFSRPALFLRSTELLERGFQLECRRTILDLPCNQQSYRRVGAGETRTVPASVMFT